MAAPVLPPFQPALGPQPAHPRIYAPNQVVLQMKEKVFSLSGDDFHVKTTDGVDILKCKGKAISLHDKKKFVDVEDRELFTLEKRLLKVHKSFHAASPDGHNFEVTGKFSIGKSRSTVEFKNHSDNAPIELEVKGSWLDRKADITLGDRPVAHISRSIVNAREVFGDKQTYFVTVAPNVDLSMIAAICVCLDERENDG